MQIALANPTLKIIDGPDLGLQICDNVSDGAVNGDQFE